jgi:hypothetical protein
VSAPGLCGCATTPCGGGCGGTPDPIGASVRFAQPVLLAGMTAAIGGARALDGLSTRDTSDPAMALADAYASALAVLGFAAARIADDGTLATSQDRGSLIDLTRLIGYMPRPAISSLTTLAFEGDTTPGAVAQAIVPVGTRIATLPKDGKAPVSFETSTELVVRGDWNRLVARRTVATPAITSAAPATAKLVVAGTDVRASAGDAMIVACSSGGWLFARIAQVIRTPAGPPAAASAVADPAALQAMTILKLTGQRAVADRKGPPAGTVAILGQRATTFGASAPDYVAVTPKHPPAQTDWSNFTLAANGDVDLEGTVKDALAGRIAVFVAGSHRQAGLITSSEDAHRSGFNLSGPVTRIVVDGVNTTAKAPTGFNDTIRALTVYVETQRLDLLALPDPGELLPELAHPERLVVLGKAARGLPPGRALALQGIDANGEARTELATLAAIAADGEDTRLTFASPAKTRFRAAGLAVLANVAEATQGTTITNPPELLGSSSAARDAPVYPLAAAPVAHVPAPGVKGFAPAAEVGVAGRRYAPVDRFLDLADDRAWRLRPRRDGRFEAEFAGRLPTGINNVTARYRVGGGAAGNVEPGAVSMVMTPVLGVAKAANITRAEGGSDAATPDGMRDAGETITTLDRVVSLADHERFARAYRGVGRAMASALRVAMQRQIVLTIATGDPAAPQPTAALKAALAGAIAAVSAPGRPPLILGYTDQLVAAAIAFAHDPALERAAVEAAVRAQIVAAFGPAARGFGQSLWASQVMAAVQGVAGVVASRVTLGNGGDPVAAVGPTVGAAASGQPVVVPAVRVAIDPAALSLTEMTA